MEHKCQLEAPNKYLKEFYSTYSGEKIMKCKLCGTYFLDGDDLTLSDSYNYFRKTLDLVDDPLFKKGFKVECSLELSLITGQKDI